MARSPRSRTRTRSRSRGRGSESQVGTQDVSHEALVQVALAQGLSREEAIQLADNMKQGKDVMRLVQEMEQQASQTSPPAKQEVTSQLLPVKQEPTSPLRPVPKGVLTSQLLQPVKEEVNSVQLQPLPQVPSSPPPAKPLRSAKELLQQVFQAAEAQVPCASFLQVLEDSTKGFHQRMMDFSSRRPADVDLDIVREDLDLVKEAIKVAKTTAKRRFSVTLPGEEDDTATAKIEVSGFLNAKLNQVYYAEPKKTIDGTPAFMGQGHFLYKREGEWWICPHIDLETGDHLLQKVQEGESWGIATQEEAAPPDQMQPWMELAPGGMWQEVSVKFQRKNADPEVGTMAPGTPD